MDASDQHKKNNLQEEQHKSAKTITDNEQSLGEQVKLNQIDVDFKGNDSDLFTIESFDLSWKEQRRKTTKIYENKYLKGDILGRGSFATVSEVLDIRTLQRRAVKRFDLNQIERLPNSDDIINRIHIEAVLLKRLNHENVAKVYDIMRKGVEKVPNLFELTQSSKKKQSNEINPYQLPARAHVNIDRRLYVFMEFCVASVHDLLEVSPEHKLPIPQANRYFKGLINGLEYLHGAGVVHKDIKPHNLLISLDDMIKIADLGICEILNCFSSSDVVSSTFGSKLYQAPEVYSSLDDLKFAGFPVDVWAAGVTLYNMTTGRYPFESDNTIKLMHLILKGDYIRTFELRESLLLDDLLYQMLIKCPKKRATIQAIKLHPWFSYDYQFTSCESVKIPPKSATGDQYRSMTITPYLHQLHAPLSSSENLIMVNEACSEEIRKQLEVPIIRGNRYYQPRKRISSRASRYFLDNRLLKALGLRQIKKGKRFRSPKHTD